jgi:hypothetical protein
MFYIDAETKTKDKFDLAKFMSFEEDLVFDSLNSYMLLQIPSLPTVGYYTVTREVNRPDLLSYKLYGDTQYWWIILWYNSLLKPQDLKAGLRIRYTSLAAIEQLYLTASLKQKTV